MATPIQIRYAAMRTAINQADSRIDLLKLVGHLDQWPVEDVSGKNTLLGLARSKWAQLPKEASAAVQAPVEQPKRLLTYAEARERARSKSHELATPTQPRPVNARPKRHWYRHPNGRFMSTADYQALTDDVREALYEQFALRL